jgi:hypothetical protein
VYSVGVFRLDLHGLLAAGFVRTEENAKEQIRLRVVRSNDGAFWIQTPADSPGLRLPDARGSRRWIREAVNRHRDLLDDAIRDGMALPPTQRIQWRSPLAADGYREYRDAEALRRLDVQTLRSPLKEFWPDRGPVWDALARTSTGALFFIEAKAHVRELVSPPSRATAQSLKKIERALSEVRTALAPSSQAPWAGTFYQYTNRLAFLYFLRQKNGLNAHLVFLNFVNAEDIQGPSSPEAWDAAYTVVHGALGLPERHSLSPFVHHIAIDVAGLTAGDATGHNKG